MSHLPGLDNWNSALWHMSYQLFVAATVILSLEIVLSVTLNTILMATISNSPVLKTPPNSLLMNICINNFLLVVCMMCSVISLCTSKEFSTNWGWVAASDLQAFLNIMCFLQYWCIFAAIGYYRGKTLKKPSISLKVRCKIIYRTILAGWALSAALSLALVLVFKNDVSLMSWNSFRRTINQTEVEVLSVAPDPGQSAILVLTLLAIVSCGVVICSSYYYIMKTLIEAQPIGNNRVSPWARTESFSLDDNDIELNKRSYRPQSEAESEGWSKEAFTISSGEVGNSVVVHFNKSQQSLTAKDVTALENPIRAHSEYNGKHPHLRATLSNGSTNMVHGVNENSGFTDISPAAELQRFQRMKNNCALRNQSWKRDRVSLISATKNSLVMITTFIFTSFPLCLCSIPGVLEPTSVGSASETLLFCHLIFYANAPIYPLWYLIFSKQVRKCLHVMFDNVLIKFNLRQ